MQKNFVKTLDATRNLKDTFKCLACHTLPTEPYFTGVCDHLFCKKCIMKSNVCAVCSASFYQKELHLNKMIKEAILYVNAIEDLVYEECGGPDKADVDKQNDDSNHSFPDIDLTFNESHVEEKPKKQTNIAPTVKQTINDKLDNFRVPIIPETLPTDTGPTQMKKQKASAKSSKQSIETINNEPEAIKNTQKINKNKSAAKKKAQNFAENINSQMENSQQAPTRSQTSRRSKKCNQKGETPLHLAVMDKDLVTVEKLLNDSNTDVNAKDFAGWTPLHEAVNSESIELVQILLEHGANVNALGYQNNTPLHEAALNKRYECVKFLLERGANPSIKNEFGIFAKDLVKTDKNFVDLFNEYTNNTAPLSQMNCAMDNNNEPLDPLNESDVCNRSQFDEFNMSHTYRNKKSKGKTQKKILIFGTGMKDEEKILLSDLASKLKIQIAKEMNNNVTHVIFAGEKSCSRTLNYMKAILMGIWVVNIKWLEDSLSKGFLLQENEYEAIGSQSIPDSNGPFKGRMNASCQYPKLFEDINIFLYGDFNVFDKQDVLKLLQLAGANILRREPKLERVDELIPAEISQHLDTDYDTNFTCCTFILSDVARLNNLRNKYLFTVRPSWLFSCIDTFKILHPDDVKKIK